MRVREKLEDFTVYFAASSVLLVRKTSYRGQEYVRYSVINLDPEGARGLHPNDGYRIA